MKVTSNNLICYCPECARTESDITIKLSDRSYFLLQIYDIFDFVEANKNSYTPNPLLYECLCDACGYSGIVDDFMRNPYE